MPLELVLMAQSTPGSCSAYLLFVDLSFFLRKLRPNLFNDSTYLLAYG